MNHVRLIVLFGAVIAHVANGQQSRPMASIVAFPINTYTPAIPDCRISVEEERRRYTDSIRFTYTLMDDLPMSYLFETDAAKAPTALSIVQHWHDKLGGMNLADFDTGMGCIRVHQLDVTARDVNDNPLTFKNPWIDAFTNVEGQLMNGTRPGGEPYLNWTYRDLFTKMDRTTDKILFDLFGVLSCMGLDLPFLNPLDPKAISLLADTKTFLDPNYCGKLDLRDFYTTCKGPPGSPDFAAIVANSELAFRAGLLYQVLPFPCSTDQMKTDCVQNARELGLCCSAQNKCVSPSHDTCTTCGSYCCLSSYGC